MSAGDQPVEELCCQGELCLCERSRFVYKKDLEHKLIAKSEVVGWAAVQSLLAMGGLYGVMTTDRDYAFSQNVIRFRNRICVCILASGVLYSDREVGTKDL